MSGILNEAHKARLLEPVDIQLAYHDYTNHFGLGIDQVQEALLHKYIRKWGSQGPEK